MIHRGKITVSPNKAPQYTPQSTQHISPKMTPISADNIPANPAFLSDCAEMVRSNQKFSYVAAQDRLRAASLRDCSGKCGRETSCNTFSYSQHNGDCNLASLEPNNLLSQDISYDSQSDIYRPLFGGNCGPGYYPNTGGNTQHQQGENIILTTSRLTPLTSHLVLRMCPDLARPVSVIQTCCPGVTQCSQPERMRGAL